MAEGFDYKGLLAQIAGQREKTQARHQAELVDQETQQGIARQQQQVVRRLETDSKPIRDDLKVTMQKRDHARQLADSGNIMDTFKLMGLQASDPMYTRKTRTARTAEDTQMLGALSSLSQVQLEALQYDSLVSKGKLDQAKLLESIGAERMLQYQNEAKFMRGQLEATEVMKAGALYGMGVPEYQKALAEAQASGGKVSINGAELSELEIREGLDKYEGREHSLRNLKHLRTLEEFNMKNEEAILADKQHQLKAQADERKRYDSRAAIEDSNLRMGVENIPANEAKNRAQAALDMDAAQGVDTSLRAQRADRERIDAANTPEAVQQGMAAQRLARQQELDRSMAVERKRVLESLADDPETLRGINKENGWSYGGVTFEPREVEDAIGFSNERRMRKINEGMANYGLESFDKQALVTSHENVGATATRLTPNTPASVAAAGYQSQLRKAAALIDSASDPIAKATIATAVDVARQKFEKELDLESGRLSNNDAGLQPLVREWLAGRPINPEQVRSLAADRIVKLKDISNIVSIKVANDARKRFMEFKNQPKDPMAWTGGGNEMDKKTQEMDWAMQAFDGAVRADSKLRLDVLVRDQITDPNHPVRELGWSPDRMLAYASESDQQALNIVRNQFDLTQAEMETIRAGKSINDVDGPAVLHALREAENQVFIEGLNGIKEGLGDRTAEWWVTSGDEYVKGNRAQHDAQMGTSNDFTRFSIASVQAQQESDEMRAYKVEFYKASETATQQRAARRAEYLSFGGKPEYAQAVLLQMMPDLQDGDRTQIYTKVIKPTIEDAKKKGLSNSQLSEYVERRFMSFDASEDKELAGILKTARRQREQATKNYRAIMEAANTSMDENNPFGFSARGKVENQMQWFHGRTPESDNPSGFIARTRRTLGDNRPSGFNSQYQ